MSREKLESDSKTFNKKDKMDVVLKKFRELLTVTQTSSEIEALNALKQKFIALEEQIKQISESLAKALQNKNISDHLPSDVNETRKINNKLFLNKADQTNISLQNFDEELKAKKSENVDRLTSYLSIISDKIIYPSYFEINLNSFSPEVKKLIHESTKIKSDRTIFTIRDESEFIDLSLKFVAIFLTISDIQEKQQKMFRLNQEAECDLSQYQIKHLDISSTSYKRENNAQIAKIKKQEQQDGLFKRRKQTMSLILSKKYFAEHQLQQSLLSFPEDEHSIEGKTHIDLLFVPKELENVKKYYFDFIQEKSEELKYPCHIFIDSASYNIFTEECDRISHGDEKLFKEDQKYDVADVKIKKLSTSVSKKRIEEYKIENNLPDLSIKLAPTIMILRDIDLNILQDLQSDLIAKDPKTDSQNNIPIFCAKNSEEMVSLFIPIFDLVSCLSEHKKQMRVSKLDQIRSRQKIFQDEEQRPNSAPTIEFSSEKSQDDETQDKPSSSVKTQEAEKEDSLIRLSKYYHHII